MRRRGPYGGKSRKKTEGNPGSWLLVRLSWVRECRVICKEFPSRSGARVKGRGKRRHIWNGGIRTPQKPHPMLFNGSIHGAPLHGRDRKRAKSFPGAVETWLAREGRCENKIGQLGLKDLFTAPSEREATFWSFDQNGTKLSSQGKKRIFLSPQQHGYVKYCSKKLAAAEVVRV